MARGIVAALGGGQESAKRAEAADQPPAVPRCEACRRRRGVPTPVLEVAHIADVGQTWLCTNANECRRFW